MMKKNKKPLITEGRVSIEHLHHFNCGKCSKWWSVGDAEVLKKIWFCPWCGIKQKVNKITLRVKRKF